MTIARRPPTPMSNDPTCFLFIAISLPLPGVPRWPGGLGLGARHYTYAAAPHVNSNTGRARGHLPCGQRSRHEAALAADWTKRGPHSMRPPSWHPAPVVRPPADGENWACGI